MFLGGLVMGNKLDILNDYQVAQRKATELSHICTKLHCDGRTQHLQATYDEKLKRIETKRDNLGVILEAINAAED